MSNLPKLTSQTESPTNALPSSKHPLSYSTNDFLLLLKCSTVLLHALEHQTMAYMVWKRLSKGAFLFD